MQPGQAEEAGMRREFLEELAVGIEEPSPHTPGGFIDFVADILQQLVLRRE
jgi:hypothetical protein